MTAKLEAKWGDGAGWWREQNLVLLLLSVTEWFWGTGSELMPLRGSQNYHSRWGWHRREGVDVERAERAEPTTAFGVTWLQRECHAECCPFVY